MASKEDIWLIARQFTSDRLAAGYQTEEFIQGSPHPKQALFLGLENDGALKEGGIIEALFGGGTGGGKSWAMLAAALKYVHIPHYSALLLRRNYPDLKQEGGLMALAHEWLHNTSARWNEVDKSWKFPSGATLRFGYLETENDKYRYQGGEYQFIGFDELTQFTENQYKYLFSRCRRRIGLDVPLRVFGATNPGGIGGQWVYDRFIPEEFQPTQAREAKTWYKEQIDGHIVAFVPSLLDDNPSLDRESYLQSLMQLDEITRQQYLSGDWQIQIRGDILYTYNELYTVISWSQFKKVFGEERIPAHWQTSIYQDFGTTEGHPCVTSWFATAAKNSPVVDGVSTAGLVFLYRGVMVNQTSARQMAQMITKAMQYDRSQCVRWLMSHEASSERIEYNEQKLPFSPWQTGRNRGIEQLKNAFILQDPEKPHPFKQGLLGHPKLFLVVDDVELVSPKSDKGLARWRSEILAYHWNTLKSGEPTTRLVPYPLFNDAVDTMRAAAADYFPRSTDKTIQEQVLDAVELVQPATFVEEIKDLQYKAHVLSQRAILAEEARKKLEQVKVIVADWNEIG